MSLRSFTQTTEVNSPPGRTTGRLPETHDAAAASSGDKAKRNSKRCRSEEDDVQPSVAAVVKDEGKAISGLGSLSALPVDLLHLIGSFLAKPLFDLSNPRAPKFLGTDDSYATLSRCSRLLRNVYVKDEPLWERRRTECPRRSLAANNHLENDLVNLQTLLQPSPYLRFVLHVAQQGWLGAPGVFSKAIEKAGPGFFILIEECMEKHDAGIIKKIARNLVRICSSRCHREGNYNDQFASAYLSLAVIGILELVITQCTTCSTSSRDREQEKDSLSPECVDIARILEYCHVRMYNFWLKKVPERMWKIHQTLLTVAASLRAVQREVVHASILQYWGEVEFHEKVGGQLFIDVVLALQPLLSHTERRSRNYYKLLRNVLSCNHRPSSDELERLNLASLCFKESFDTELLDSAYLSNIERCFEVHTYAILQRDTIKRIVEYLEKLGEEERDVYEEDGNCWRVSKAIDTMTIVAVSAFSDRCENSKCQILSEERAEMKILFHETCFRSFLVYALFNEQKDNGPLLVSKLQLLHELLLEDVRGVLRFGLQRDDPEEPDIPNFMACDMTFDISFSWSKMRPKPTHLLFTVWRLLCEGCRKLDDASVQEWKDFGYLVGHIGWNFMRIKWSSRFPEYHMMDAIVDPFLEAFVEAVDACYSANAVDRHNSAARRGDVWVHWDIFSEFYDHWILSEEEEAEEAVKRKLQKYASHFPLPIVCSKLMF